MTHTAPTIQKADLRDTLVNKRDKGATTFVFDIDAPTAAALNLKPEGLRLTIPAASGDATITADYADGYEHSYTHELYLDKDQATAARANPAGFLQTITGYRFELERIDEPQTAEDDDRFLQEIVALKKRWGLLDPSVNVRLVS
ncbi:hypothetical protein [Aliihoeflea sp. 2WW]|uniref:hypothetical protein n=1 Tax=Aliihoeflea sp. 2WW TaxID=1381123 RepID=UPI000463B9D5|nr:hypothetical protein [Aliihoeflea sp. 2WW]